MGGFARHTVTFETLLLSVLLTISFHWPFSRSAYRADPQLR